MTTTYRWQDTNGQWHDGIWPKDMKMLACQVTETLTRTEFEKRYKKSYKNNRINQLFYVDELGDPPQDETGGSGPHL